MNPQIGVYDRRTGRLIRTVDTVPEGDGRFTLCEPVTASPGEVVVLGVPRPGGPTLLEPCWPPPSPHSGLATTFAQPTTASAPQADRQNRNRPQRATVPRVLASLFALALLLAALAFVALFAIDVLT